LSIMSDATVAAWTGKTANAVRQVSRRLGIASVGGILRRRWTAAELRLLRSGLHHLEIARLTGMKPGAHTGRYGMHSRTRQLYPLPGAAARKKAAPSHVKESFEFPRPLAPASAARRASVQRGCLHSHPRNNNHGINGGGDDGLTCYHIDPQRGSDALRVLGVDCSGTLVHDGYN
jgi:hypothetical protein